MVSKNSILGRGLTLVADPKYRDLEAPFPFNE